MSRATQPTKRLTVCEPCPYHKDVSSHINLHFLCIAMLLSMCSCEVFTMPRHAAVAHISQLSCVVSISCKHSVISTYTNYTTTATYQQITSVTLTPGDWEIQAFSTFNSNTSTITASANAVFVIATATASATGSVEGQSVSYIPQAALVGTSKQSSGSMLIRVSISAATTYYLNSQSTFTIGNPQFVGSLRATRIR